MDGLSTVDEQLARDVAAYDETRLRRVTAAVVRLGLDRAQVQDPRLDAALTRLDAAAWGDEDDPVRAAVRDLVEEWDEVAWDAQDVAESAEGDTAAYDAAFARARAVSAVDFALDRDPLKAALESAYEVQAGLGDLPAVAAVLRSSTPSAP